MRKIPHLSFVLTFVLAALAHGQVPSPTTSPEPSAPTQAASSVTTLEELQARIRTRLAAPEVARGQVGIKVVSLMNGKVIFEQNAEKYFMPASNMKNFTVAAALEKLTPEYRYITAVFAGSRPDSNGTIVGPVRVEGRGDVSISYSFHEGDRNKGIDRLIDALEAAGVKRIEGDIIGDASYFTGNPLPTGWEWDDLQFYYGAEVSALPINDNVVGLSVTPGPAGLPCSVRMNPQFLVMRVINKCITSASGTTRTLRIRKPLDRNEIEISGDLPAGNSGFSGFVSISRPAEMFAALLRERLLARNITVTGRAYAVHEKDLVPAGTTVEVARIESPPLALIAAKTMKPSQNMYTEVLLWTLGEVVGRGAPAAGETRAMTSDSSTLGRAVVKDFLKGIGTPEDAVVQSDGSGLSRHNLVTPSSVVRLYTYMANQSRYADAWRNSLTVAGVDGTLQNRFRGTRGQANVRGKTGTINQVSALSGYLNTASGEQLVFSILVNGVPETRDRTGLIDEIVLMLVNFNGSLQ